jgi:lipoprotein-anchoring transpeptidase ErfK/SrfK
MTVQRINTRGSIGGAKGRGALATALLLVAVQALAQEKQSTPTRPIRATSESAERVTTRRIVVSIPDRKLALIEDGRLVKAYPVAVGAPASPSPAGEFTIAHRIAHPTYYSPGVIIPPGQANPLGTRWLGLDQRGYGIHGTNQPHSIGHRASHGCIRMRNHDMEELFELVEVGDAVELHAERTAELAEIFGGPEVSAAVGQD